jgi:hypothetical protein
MIWAALLLVTALAAPGAWAWHISSRFFAATSETQQRRVLRRAVSASAGVGVAILAAGVAVFVAADYNWLVLAVIWAFGLLHLGLVGLAFRRERKRTGRAGSGLSPSP